jgi:hypothetical protein
MATNCVMYRNRWHEEQSPSFDADAATAVGAPPRKHAYRGGRQQPSRTLSGLRFSDVNRLPSSLPRVWTSTVPPAGIYRQAPGWSWEMRPAQRRP